MEDAQQTREERQRTSSSRDLSEKTIIDAMKKIGRVRYKHSSPACTLYD